MKKCDISHRYDGTVYVSENNRRLFVFKRLENEVWSTLRSGARRT